MNAVGRASLRVMEMGSQGTEAGKWGSSMDADQNHQPKDYKVP